MPIRVVFSQHEAFGRNCLDRAMACEYAFKGTNPSGIALKYCVRWREPESLQSRSYCLLCMAMGTCQPLMGTRKCLVGCQCAMKQRGWWGTTGPVWASPASFANIDTSGEVRLLLSTSEGHFSPTEEMICHSSSQITCSDGYWLLRKGLHPYFQWNSCAYKELTGKRWLLKDEVYFIWCTFLMIKWYT